ncbi:MAG: hypothetical protein NZ941_04910 [Candidatus Caldarchaeum sp.]|nr:hypothetical protein [Candidatus Caldarchaeum sp.]
MCGICGELVAYVHWAERVPWKSDDVVESGGDVAKIIRRLRMRKAEIVNTVLSFYGLSFSDWQGRKYLLSDKKGNFVLVDDLAGLWARVERLLGKPFDPLDENVLKFLASAEQK